MDFDTYPQFFFVKYRLETVNCYLKSFIFEFSRDL